MSEKFQAYRKRAKKIGKRVGAVVGTVAAPALAIYGAKKTGRGLTVLEAGASSLVGGVAGRFGGGQIGARGADLKRDNARWWSGPRGSQHIRDAGRHEEMWRSNVRLHTKRRMPNVQPVLEELERAQHGHNSAKSRRAKSKLWLREMDLT